jgi:hypothetical protein
MRSVLTAVLCSLAAIPQGIPRRLLDQWNSRAVVELLPRTPVDIPLPDCYLAIVATFHHAQ